MAEERRASRRDLFKLIGRTLADAAGKRIPPLPPPPALPPKREPPAPAVEIPLERGRMVVDLAVHPIVPGSGKRFRGAGAPEVVLLARVTPEHLAGVSGDCPHCGGPLSFDGRKDRVLCPRGEATFRLDGCVDEGAAFLRLRTYLCRRIGARVEIDAVPT
jgi:nitrite reductase/ring-hydroxylating ferredoxin subunit